MTGIAASVFTALSLIPQLYIVLKKKEAENVSLGMLLILFIGLGLWILYGIQKTDIIIIASNSFSFVLNLVLAFFSIRYKRSVSINPV